MDFDSDLYTNQTDVLKLSGEREPDGYKLTGILMALRAKYTCVGTETTNDVIRVAKLPPNIEVLPWLIALSSDSNFPNLIVDFGYTDDPDAFFDQVTLRMSDSDSPENFWLPGVDNQVVDAGGGHGGGTGVILTENSWKDLVRIPADQELILTLKAGGSPTAGFELNFFVPYIGHV